MNVRNLVEAMEAIAPTRLAESWDNVGLIVGDAEAQLRRILLCIDLTPSVLAEARAHGAGAVVAYHPPIFKGLRHLRAGDVASGVIFDAVRHNIAVYSPHTALDVAPGGTNDVLADALYLTSRKPLRPAGAGEASEVKLVTFVPAEQVDAVAAALFEAGAGRIGNYDQCSFRTNGTGSFRGGEGSNPAVGEAGQSERVEEVRLEVVVKRADLAAVVAALRSSHPYEEPAYDVFPRLDVAGDVGLGRIGEFEDPVSRDVLIGRARRELNVEHLLVAGPLLGDVRRIAVCAGSCGDLLDVAAAQGAEFYLTGELKHHDALRAARLGMTVACVLHSNSERATLDVLRRQLVDRLSGVAVEPAESDRDPFTIV